MSLSSSSSRSSSYLQGGQSQSFIHLLGKGGAATRRGRLQQFLGQRASMLAQEGGGEGRQRMCVCVQGGVAPNRAGEAGQGPHHDSMGMPLSSWKPKAWGELSTMMVWARSRPSTAGSGKGGGGAWRGETQRGPQLAGAARALVGRAEGQAGALDASPEPAAAPGWGALPPGPGASTQSAGSADTRHAGGGLAPPRHKAGPGHDPSGPAPMCPPGVCLPGANEAESRKPRPHPPVRSLR